MSVRTIVTPPNPTLREKAKKVRNFDQDLSRLIDDMIETLRAASGVGLAAPQVDVGQRVIVVEYGESSDDPETPSKPPKLYVFVNPEIARQSRETLMGVEACLSIPGFFGEVERSASVTVKGLNRSGGPQKIKTKGWLARIFQHEIDHLDGILYIDHAEKVWRVEQAQEIGESGDGSGPI